MSTEKLNPKFDLPLKQLEDAIHAHVNGDFCGYDYVVSPRDLQKVTGLAFFRRDTFESLIRGIPLRTESAEKIYPYENARINVFGREPKGLDIGQVFVLRDKLVSIMENLGRGVFAEYVTKGLSKMPPIQIYGLDSEGRKVMAFYIPPIIEIHGDRAVLVDGSHRSYLCGSAGTTINAAHISNVEIPLPFDPQSFDKVQIVTEKPPIEQRYQNLRRKYFRDLAAVGIDG